MLGAVLLAKSVLLTNEQLYDIGNSPDDYFHPRPRGQLSIG